MMCIAPCNIYPYLSVSIIVAVFATILQSACSEGNYNHHSCQNDGMESTCRNYRLDYRSSDEHLLEVTIPELKSWIESLGGRFHESQEIRPVLDNSASNLGVFATDDIEKGDELLFIPWEAIVTSTDFVDNEDDDFSSDENEWCDLVNAMLQNFRNPEEPLYYFDYLEKKTNTPPELWSNEGRELLQSMLGLNLPPEDVKHFSEETSISVWTDSCGGEDTEDSQKIAVFVDACHHDFNMVPMLDLYNFHRSEVTGTKTEFGTKGMKLLARRKLYKSHQIFVTNGQQRKFTTSEIFGNYGYVEQMPHHWVLGNKLDFIIHKNKFDEFQVGVNDLFLPTYNDVSFLMEEEDRLSSFSLHAQELGIDNFLGVKNDEWDMIWQYNYAIRSAIKLLLRKIDDDNLIDTSPENEDAYLKSEDEMEWKENEHTCKLDDAYMTSTDDDVVIESKYQVLTFFEKPEIEDVCLDLDGTLQICHHYRPYYHEPFVQFSSTLLREMKRVVFVGGGDSMLLHEVMKFPEVELVLGLELDQMVVRQSFKRFHTQPHFDLHDKVQWWFGDATKSLKLLPKKYFGSFDLVMIDLSETVMSFSVTKKLDMISALSLLIKPDGIFMKNERYFQKFQKMFDSTVELHLRDNPTLCCQYFAIGSHQANLLTPTFDKMHNIETLMYKPLVDPFNHYKLIQNYSKNMADICFDGAYDDSSDDESEDEENIDENEWTGGILMILEAEEISVGGDEVEAEMTECLDKIGFTVLSSFSYKMLDGSVTVIIFKEGYVIGRYWSNYSYIGFDINLWRGFNKIDFIKDSLIQSMGSYNSSAYRIVVGGISQSNIETSNQEDIGPQIIDHRKCEAGHVDEIDIDDLMISESLNLLKNINDGSTVLFCNDINSCTNLDTFDNTQKENILILKSCDSNSQNGQRNTFSLCGSDFETDLKSLLKKEMIVMKNIIFNENFSFEVMKSIIDVLSRKDDQRSFLQSVSLVIAPQADDKKKSLLEKFRLKIQKGPITLMRIDNLGSNSQAFLMGIGIKSMIQEVTNMVERIKVESGYAGIEIMSILGEPIKWQDNFNPQYFNRSHYDSLPGLDQFSRQMPLGSQTIFQYENPTSNAWSTKRMSQKISKVFKNSVKEFFEIVEYQRFSDLGDGVLIIIILQEGHAILQWDGFSHIDLNVFTYDEDIDHESLGNSIMQSIPGFSLSLKDEQPRGVSRVVNFKRDIGARTPGCWDVYVICKAYEKNGYCDVEHRESWMHEDWMLQNCRKSCGKCHLEH